jgi:hypothetical protein
MHPAENEPEEKLPECNIRWTGLAIRDVQQAWDFVAADNPLAPIV